MVMTKMKQTQLDIEVARTKSAIDGSGGEADSLFGPIDGFGEFSELFANPGLVVAGTGHRPDVLGGYSEQARLRLVDFARWCLTDQFKTVVGDGNVISGMALGWDQALAEAAVSLGIPVLAAVPCDGQDATWPQAARKRYRAFLEHPLVRMHVVCPGPYKPWKMQVRNEWMVDRSHYLLALYDHANHGEGGTANCVKYAWDKIEAKRGPCPRFRNVWADWEQWCLRG